MGEYNSQRDVFWTIYERLLPAEQAQYLWQTFGDSLMDQVKNWDDETLTDAIEELKERERRLR